MTVSNTPVAVITGASSGIGRATALAFARRGTAVVLAARREEPLRELAEHCRSQYGVAALACPVDVTDERAVGQLAERAVTELGAVDVWVNNAAVSLYARLEEAPMAEIRRVIDTNLFGYLHGARAVLPHFRERRAGVLINNASVVASVPQPYTGAYTISKWGVRALSAVLRQELVLDGVKGIHVCTVMPAVIDTPFFQHAGNLTGRQVRAMPPVYPPERVARAIVRLAHHPRREVYVGNSGRFMAWQQRMAPGLTERAMAVMVDRQHLHRYRPAPPSTGNIDHPVPEGVGTDGGWGGQRSQAVRRAVTAGAGTAGIALAAWARRRQRSSV